MHTSCIQSMRVLLIASAPIWATLSGCTRTDLKVNDGSAVLVSGTVVTRLDSLKFGSKISSQGGIELSYEHQSGSGTQGLYPSQYITYDQRNSNSLHSSSGLDPNLTLTGPQSVEATARVDHGHVAYNHLFNFSSLFELEPSIGLSYDKADITVLGLTDRKEIKQSPHALGLTIGIIPRWKFNEHFSVDARVRFGASGDGDYTMLLNPALVYNISHTIFLSAGYADRRQYIKTENASDNYFHFSGPSAALRIEF